MTERSRLTGREKQILIQLSEGLTSKEIAARLKVQPKTISNHLTKIFRKINVHDRFEAIELIKVRGDAWFDNNKYI